MNYIHPQNFLLHWSSIQSPNTKNWSKSWACENYSCQRCLALISFLSHMCQSQWPRGLRRRSATSRLLGLRVRIQPGAWTFHVVSVVLSGRGLYEGLTALPRRVLPSVVCLNVNSKPQQQGGLGQLGLLSYEKILLMVYALLLWCWGMSVMRCSFKLWHPQFHYDILTQVT